MENKKTYTIDNCVKEYSRDKATPAANGYEFWLVDREFIDGRTLKLRSVFPGTGGHAPHAHIEDEFFFVLEGVAEFYLDGKTKTAGAYTNFYCPSGVMHGIRNAGDGELKYLVIKKYEK
jgi:mannose-6-phosphate isomerase-like protein (cupin superfamily)